MRITDLRAENGEAIQQAAVLLVEGFKEHHPDAWPDMAAALEAVHECLAEDRISRVAVDGQGNVMGWIGATPEYDGNSGNSIRSS